MKSKYKYFGMWPVAPTPFHDNGEVDYDSMSNILECMIDQQADGICILANYSEQFLLSDDEREKLTKHCLRKIDGRVKTITTISHFSTDIALARANLAKSEGTDILMSMPPFYGPNIKGNEEQIYKQFEVLNSLGIDIMYQDAPEVSGIDASVPFLTKLISDFEYVNCFKIESAQPSAKIKQLIKNCDGKIQGPMDGLESISVLSNLYAGISGSMSSALLPDKIRPVVMDFLDGKIDSAVEKYNNILPLINFEHKQCGFQATKIAMKEGGVIKSAFCRHPIKILDDHTKNLLISIAKKYDLVSMNWGK